MNALFLYNENVPLTLKDSFADSLGSVSSFKILKDEMLTPSFSVDRKISEYLLSQEIEQKRYSVIFIPYSLSEENYMEFLGLRMAYHIRLTKDFNNIQTPIVFYGLESEWEINKLTNLGQILFTPNIYSTQKINFDDFQKMINYIQESSSSSELSDESFTKRIISKISLDPPGNYQSHHSIDNELALLRWSTYLGCDNEIPEVKNNLNTGLYFKYYNALNPIKKLNNGTPFRIEGEANILLIDDQSEKGWRIFYSTLFEPNSSIEFDSLNVDYQRLTQNEIITEAVNKIKEFNADVILLDLRLCDADFNKNIKPEDLTGVQILNKIKQDINKGIQVIITTASNKVWTYKTTISKGAIGADEYIIKSSDHVEQLIISFKKTIETSMKKAFELKPIYLKLDKLNKFELSLSDSFKFNTLKNIEISFDLLSKSYSEEKYKNYAYLQLFIIIEEFISEESIFLKNPKGPNYVIGGENKELLVFDYLRDQNNGPIYKSAIKFRNGNYKIEIDNNYRRRLDTNAIVSALLIFRYGLNTSGEKKWTKIYSTRNNKAAHPEHGIVTHEEIIDLIDFLIFITDDKKINLQNQNSSLEKPTFEDQINRLREKFEN